jgi:lipid-A-disaccharide synthase-like uncharacterized protein
VKPPALIALTMIVLACLAVAVAVFGPVVRDMVGGDGSGVQVKVKLRGVAQSPRLVETSPGELHYRLVMTDGEVIDLTPRQFARRLFDERSTGPWWKRLMNITTPVGIAWVALGLLGQVLFAGRMIVQWLVSERKRQSTVPTAFWWMSLLGASMLLTYFLWRKDVVGVLGQGTGWLIYIRNLWLIYHRRGGADLMADPAPEAALEEPAGSDASEDDAYTADRHSGAHEPAMR